MTTQDFTGRLALTRVETSHFLGLSPATIDRLAKRGLLCPCRATRRPLYPLAELHRFLTESKASLPASQHFLNASSIGGTSHGKEVNENGQTH